MRREISAIARRSGGRTYYLTNLDGLDRVYAQIGAELRSQYFLAVTTDRTLTPKELEKLEVKVLRKNLAVRTLLASQQNGS